MITTRNPWGLTQEFDAQRSDLWQLDLNPVYNIVREGSGVAKSLEYNWRFTADAADTIDFVRKITLPESAVSAIRVISGTQFMNAPGYDDPMSATRIDFYHEVAKAEINSQRSVIYNLLNCWHMLAMAGQKRSGNRGVPLPLLSSSSKPVFMCNLPLTLLKGDTHNYGALTSGSTYSINKCWISDLQLPDFDYGRADVASIVATLQVGSITLAR